MARKPGEIMVDVASAADIKDPLQRRSALRKLDVEAAQAADAAEAAGDPPKLYDEVQKRIGSELTQAGSDYRDQTPTPKADRTPEQTAADQADAASKGIKAQNDVALQSQREKNRAAGNGYFTDAELDAKNRQSTADSRAAASDTRAAESHTLSLQQAQTSLDEAKIRLQRLIQNDPSKLDAAKFEYQQLHDQVQELQHQEDQRQAERQSVRSNATQAMGQEVSQGNSRASTAASVYDNAVSRGADIFKGAAPGQGAILANGIQALNNGGTEAVANAPGAAPVPFTQQHFQELQQLVNSGQVPPDAQGNVVPNAVQLLAQKYGGASGGGPPPSYGPSNSPQPLTITAPSLA